MHDSRRARSDKVCRLLTERIGQVTSRGLGRWDDAWRVVDTPSSRFLDALAEWEHTGEEAAMGRAKALALEVLAAWKEAERRYQSAGRPEPHSRLMPVGSTR